MPHAWTDADLKGAIDEAIAHERERCAQIAETWHPMLYAPEMGGQYPRDAAYAGAKQAIADAIRKAD